MPFLSGVDLAIHEFGHMLLEPFGIAFLERTMVILGGSLAQVMFPLLFMLYFCATRMVRAMKGVAWIMCVGSIVAGLIWA